MPSVLIVDDLSAIHEMLAAVIQPTGYSMAFASDGGEALSKYKAEPSDVVLADISMQPMDGITLLQQLKQYDPGCVVIMMTGYASTETAVKALKFGAFDYIQKPFKIDELLRTLKRAIEFHTKSRSKRAETSAEPEEADLSGYLVGPSPENQRLLRQLNRLVGTHTPLLIQGEKGTGKTLVAELLHKGPNGGDKPFILVDCSLSGEIDLRSGLLGESAEGGEWIERARGGVLFLQHIHRLPRDFQRELVSVIKRNINETRIICSSDIDLEAAVDEGEFDDELFYRIASLPIVLPPLRERMEDLPALIAHFAKRAKNPSFESPQIEFSPAAISRMQQYAWPGNLLELNQLVGNLVSTTGERVIDVDQLPPQIGDDNGWPSLDEFLEAREREYVRKVLHYTGGNKERAAKILGCDPAKLEDAELTPKGAG